jgi:lipopolysaccharide/colanic/teichoic acid biosynthesis glycosyltransferase
MATSRRRLPPIGNRLPERRAREPLATGEFMRTLAREVARSERTGEVLSLMVIGLERAFAEDLRLLLDYLQSRLRLTDDVGWLEDQSLAVLLPMTGSAQAHTVAESILAALGEAQSRIHWQLLSSDRDPALFESSPTPFDRDSAAPPPSDREDPPSGGAERNGHRHEARRVQAQPLAPLLLVPIPARKRVFDVICAALMLLALSPLFLLVALAIKLDSRGPVLFRQPRVGQGGRVFDLLKFRTMVVNAEELLADLQADNHRDGPAFKIRKDPRITRVGRWIRGNAIDELPQLWNVLMGDMTMVGPRPMLPREVAHYEDWQRARLRVVGGLTCIWQVDGRLRNVPFADWMRQDIRYGTRYSARRDFALIARTAWVVLSRRGDH